MGWFEEQVKKRKKLDEQTFEDSFLSLAGVQTQDAALSEAAQRENFAISQIMGYFRLQMPEIPAKVDEFKAKLHYALRPTDVTYQPVELGEAWTENNTLPLLVFTKANHTPVVLLPRSNKGFYYHNFRTGKKAMVHPEFLEKLETEAYRFYRPFSTKKISVREYARYIQSSMRPWETVLFILVSALVVAVGFLLPYLTKTLTGDVVQQKDLNQFIMMSVYVVATATGLLLMKAFQAFVNNRIALRREKAIRESMMMRLLSLPPSFFKRYNTGELNSRFLAVPRLANVIVNGIFLAVVSTVLSLAHLFQLIGFAPVLVWPVAITLAVSTTFTIVSALMQRNYNRTLLELTTKEAGVSYEMINGIQKIRLSGSEKRVFAKWAAVYSKETRVRYRPPLLLRIGPAITLLITLVGNVAMYYLAAANNLTVADYMAFTTSYGLLSAAFASVGQTMGLVSTIQPLFEMARPLLEAQPENVQGKKVLDTISGNIHFENVSFRYNETSPWIIKNISLDIHEGEYIAIVGQTGCGKSTFARLLLGFETPTSGTVSYDGLPMAEVDLPSLRRNIGTVMQNGSLFHADIFSNIIISAPQLTEADAWRAAEIADIAEDIKAMPMKMKTVISEGQGGISGGQKQRIMIARAIVHQPKVLIFDEATSALDNKTQKNISDSIAKLQCTRIVIAHRLSTIRHADRIIMLEGGKIVESGDYDTLIALKGRFAELVDRQRLDKGQQGDSI